MEAMAGAGEGAPPPPTAPQPLGGKLGVGALMMNPTFRAMTHINMYVAPRPIWFLGVNLLEKAARAARVGGGHAPTDSVRCKCVILL